MLPLCNGATQLSPKKIYRQVNKDIVVLGPTDSRTPFYKNKILSSPFGCLSCLLIEGFGVKDRDFRRQGGAGLGVIDDPGRRGHRKWRVARKSAPS